jgi:chorismate mutase/quercetin dioxygenase-like cupin family protein
MDLISIRKNIDDLDSMIITLLAKRANLVSAAGRLKKTEQGVRDPKRVEEVIEKVKARATEAGLDPGIAAEIYRTVINCFIGRELKEFSAAGPGRSGVTADEFPKFMKHPANAVAGHQKSDGVDGYVFDGVDGSQLVLFECAKDGISKEHVHFFDEYFVVVQGEYTLGIEGRKIALTAGREFFIPKGTPHDGSFTEGTRTINAFGGKRADREADPRKEGQ